MPDNSTFLICQISTDWLFFADRIFLRKQMLWLPKMIYCRDSTCGKTTLGLMVMLACWTEVLDLISCWDSKCTFWWLVFLQSLVFFVVGVVLLWQGLDGQADPHQHGRPVLRSNPRYDVLHRDQAHPLCQEPVPLPLLEERNMTCSCAEQFLYVLAVKGCVFSIRSVWKEGFHMCLEALIMEWQCRQLPGEYYFVFWTGQHSKRETNHFLFMHHHSFLSSSSNSLLSNEWRSKLHPLTQPGWQTACRELPFLPLGSVGRPDVV